MSTSGGKKGTGKGPPKKAAEEDKSSSASKAVAEKEPDVKDDGSSNGDKKDAAKNDDFVPKPQSAGASTRDTAQRILTLAQKGEWAAVEQTLKNMEKTVANGGDDVNSVPLAGVLYVVRIYFILIRVIFLNKSKQELPVIFI